MAGERWKGGGIHGQGREGKVGRGGVGGKKDRWAGKEGVVDGVADRGGV